MWKHPLAAHFGLAGGAISGASGAFSLIDKLYPTDAAKPLSQRPAALVVLGLAASIAAVLGAMSASGLAETNAHGYPTP